MFIASVGANARVEHLEGWIDQLHSRVDSRSYPQTLDRLEKPNSAKHSSLLEPFVRYEENTVL